MSVNDPLAKAANPFKGHGTPQQMLDRLMSGMDMNGAEPSIATPKKASKQSFNDKLANRIASARETLEMLESASQDLDKLAIDEGDAAFHPDHGNVLIQGYSLGGDATIEAISKEMHGKIVAKIVTINNGIKQVLATSLLPLNETTKVLYGKSK